MVIFFDYLNKYHKFVGEMRYFELPYELRYQAKRLIITVLWESKRLFCNPTNY